MEDRSHLTNKDFWNNIYKNGFSHKKSQENKLHFGLLQKYKDCIRKLFEPNILEKMNNYVEYLQWHVLYPQFLMNRQGQSVVEIGSAPGKHLVMLKERFGLAPFGIEYSENGVLINRQNFAEYKIPEENVIWADFFSPDVQKKFKNFFDIVLSRGFVEHFQYPQEVIDKHLQLLKPGGLLIVSIPNFRKINYLLARLFIPSVLPLHNLEIMDKKNFTKLFYSNRLEMLYCDYFGIFTFNLFGKAEKKFWQIILNQLQNFQLVLNLVFRSKDYKKRYETKFFSPYLIFVGMKK